MTLLTNGHWLLFGDLLVLLTPKHLKSVAVSAFAALQDC